MKPPAHEPKAEGSREVGLIAEHFYWFDWIRFLAAFMVVIFHARGGHWVEWARIDPEYKTPLVQLFFIVTRAGPDWVIVFFVLSGFLVGGKVIERSLKGTFDPVAFAIDRFTRIWVPLTPALVLTGIVAVYCGLPASLPVFLGNLFGLQGIFCDNYGQNASLWTLSYEIWFYLLSGIAATIVVGKKGGRLWWILGLLVCFAAFTRLAPNYLFSWMLGAFCYFLSTGKKWGRYAVFGVLLAILGGATAQLRSDSVSLNFGAFSQWLPSYDVGILILSLGVGFILAAVHQRKPVSAGMVRLEKWGASLAAFSYTLYLTHDPILNLWDKFMPNRLIRFDGYSLAIYASKLSSCLLAAWILYLIFESRTVPFRRWLKRKLAPAEK